MKIVFINGIPYAQIESAGEMSACQKLSGLAKARELRWEKDEKKTDRKHKTPYKRMCPSCGKKLRGKKGVAQHMSWVHSGTRKKQTNVKNNF